MSDLISRRAMIDKMRRHKEAFCKNRIEFMALPKDEQARVDEIDNCISDLVNAPDAEPERKIRKWIKDETGYDFWRCSVCSFGVDILYHFCPNCGAEMRGEYE